MIPIEKAKELKPCPFCGSEADYSIGEKGDGTPWDYIECLECGATTEPEIWNRRAEPEAEKPEDTATIDAMEVAIKIVDNDREIEDDARAIQQYAESFHSKKCAECTQKKAPYKPFDGVYWTEQCVSCTLQCPSNDCPLDKEPK